jgi:hypothetical protein
MHLMSRITTFLTGFNDFFLEGGNFNAAQFTRVTTSQQESSDITILTAEGDRVTISADSQLSIDCATYSGLVRSNGLLGSVKTNELVIDSNRDLYISVEGDLSRQELEDIKKAIKSVDKIMGQVLSGNMEKAVAMTNKLGSLDSISSLEASMELEKTVTTEQTFVMSVDKGTTESINNTLPEDIPIIQDPFKPATDQMMDVLLNSGVHLAKAARPFDQYMSKLLKSLSGKDNVNEKTIEAAKLIRADLLERIKGLSRNEEIPEEVLYLDTEYI